MNDDSDDLAEALRELASEAHGRQAPGAHPRVEQLTAYHAGGLTPAAADEIQEHLAVCRQCTRLLLDLPSFLEPPVGARDSFDEETDAAWQDIRRRLPAPPRPPARDAVATTPSGPRSRRRTLRISLRLAAAAALVGLIAAPLWMVASRLAAPELPPETLHLYPSERQRGTSEPPAASPTVVHAAARSTILIVRLEPDQPGRRFRVELRAAGTGPSAAPVLLPVTEVLSPHSLLLVLDRHQLAPGRYQLRVLDADHPAAEPLGDYALDVIER